MVAGRKRRMGLLEMAGCPGEDPEVDLFLFDVIFYDILHRKNSRPTAKVVIFSSDLLVLATAAVPCGDRKTSRGPRKYSS